MKIGIFDPYLPALSGGEKYVLTAAACLAKSHEVFIFWDEEAEIKNRAKNKLSIDLSDVFFTENIFKKNYPRLKRLIRSKDFDYIFFLSDGSVPFVLSKLILHFQFPLEWIKNNPKIEFKIKRASIIVCNSNFTKSFIDKKLKVKSEVIYPPCEIKNVENEKENIILHVGRFGKDIEGRNFKKQDLMINAFKRAEIKDWSFVLVIGVMPEDRKKANELKTLAEGFPIEIVENPSNERLWDLYSKAKIYWHASGFGEDLEKHPEYAEHFGISTVEAMGAGAVPVVINAGGQKEIVDNGKNGFLWNTLEELLEKTKELTSDHNLWLRLSKEAINKSKIYSKETFCKNINSLIK